MTKTLISLLLLTALLPLAAADEPATSTREDLRAELQQARSELAAAAQRVATLSRQLSEPGLSQRWAERDPERWRNILSDLPESAAIGRAVTMMWTPRLGLVLGPAAGNDGRLIRAVTPGSSAAAAGIEAGERLISMDGIELGAEAAGQVRQLLREREAGDEIVLELDRDGARRRVTVVLETPELSSLSLLRGEGEGLDLEALSDLLSTPGRPGRSAMLGRQTQLAPMHAGLAPYFGTEQGVLVLRIDADNALKLAAGDVILAIDGAPVSLPAELMRRLMRSTDDATLNLEILRRGESMQLVGRWEGERPQPPARRRSTRPGSDD